MKKVLVAYATMSGNTEEVAEIVRDYLEGRGVEVDYRYIDLVDVGPPPPVKLYDEIFIGTYTWNFGEVPDEVVDYANNLGELDIPVHVFATGETQFGEEVYCVAGDLLAEFLNSGTEVLKIEQSPRGIQEQKVREWVEGIYHKGRELAWTTD